MRKDLVAIVCCPVHKSALELTVKKAEDNGDVVEGTLRCSRCKFDYPIEEGIPNLLPPEYHVDQVKAAKEPARAPPKPATKARGKK